MLKHLVCHSPPHCRDAEDAEHLISGTHRNQVSPVNFLSAFPVLSAVDLRDGQAQSLDIGYSNSPMRSVYKKQRFLIHEGYKETRRKLFVLLRVLCGLSNWWVHFSFEANWTRANEFVATTTPSRPTATKVETDVGRFRVVVAAN
jgi:hypothetical protein